MASYLVLGLLIGVLMLIEAKVEKRRNRVIAVMVRREQQRLDDILAHREPRPWGKWYKRFRRFS